MKISIVLPVYNVSKYLENNIESLINQTYENIEIIYVDDESPDDSVKIIKKYQKKHKNIHLYSKKNGGVSTARNYGLSKATGEYLTFIDSDDTVSHNLCEILAETIKKQNKPDIIIYDYQMVYPNKTNNMTVIDGFSRIITPNEYMLTTPCPWNKIYKRKFLEKHDYHFPEGIIYEDLAATPTLAKYNPQVYYLKKYLYNYIQSDSSLMRSKTYKKNYEDIFPAIDYLYESLKDTEYTKELEFLITYHMLYLASLNFYKYRKLKNIDRIADIMKERFPNWINNELVSKKFDGKKLFYMNLFYNKRYRLIDIYQIITLKRWRNG